MKNQFVLFLRAPICPKTNRMGGIALAKNSYLKRRSMNFPKYEGIQSLQLRYCELKPYIFRIGYAINSVPKFLGLQFEIFIFLLNRCKRNFFKAQVRSDQTSIEMHDFISVSGPTENKTFRFCF